MTDYNVLQISEFDQYLIGQGLHYHIYQKLGAHLTEKDGVQGTYFAVWAPNAREIYVTGDFNNWDKRSHKMEKLGDLGVWELFIPELSEGALYKYAVVNCHGQEVLKADPFAFSSEVRPGNASKIADIDGFSWEDGEWMEARAKKDMKEEPMYIYEVHPGSWKKHPYRVEYPQGFYTYKEFAHALADYVLDMGYTHVELIGIAEHPFDGSWGYQVTGYYAPTSRHGSPKEFMYLVNYLHSKGIGVILDWVPAHFPKDAHGLAEFDGTCLYEYADYKKGNHPQWGTKIFDYGKNEVKNYLIGNALYWLREYHIDGLRVDAVASMLYLDFCRDADQWDPNQYGDNRNIEAIEFIKHLNSIVDKENSGAMVIAEESTAWPQITGKTEDGGLGFSFKWNMGWMNDFLEYMEMDPVYRQYHHNKMNFSMMYAYKENYIQVLSHDEVVHLKKSMLGKMPGQMWDQFANLRAAYAYMTGHPGKKLLFMGQDFGQGREWSEEREVDWYQLGHEMHAGVQNFMRDLIHIYRNYPCMYELDCKEAGFTWVNADDNERSIFSFERHSKDGKESLLFVCNFTPIGRSDYRVGAYENTEYELVLNSDCKKYGGGGVNEGRNPMYYAEEIPADNRDYSFNYDLPAYGAAVFKFRKPKKKEYIYGIDVGGTTTKMGIFKNTGDLIEKWEIPTRTEESGRFILDDIAKAMKDKREELDMTPDMFIGAGVGIPGPVDGAGVVNGCVNLGWGVVDVKGELSEKTGLPVCVGNDANVAALGECWKGAAEGRKNAVMVTLGTGVGGGLVFQEKIFAGSHGAGGEIGHMCVNDKERVKCNCGNRGCLEQYASATGIVRMAKRALRQKGVKSALKKCKPLTAKDVFDEAKKGDAVAMKLVKETGELLGKSLANIAAVCDPQVFIIGGGVSKAGEILQKEVEKGYEKYAFHACKETEILLAELGNDAGIYGSARMLLD